MLQEKQKRKSERYKDVMLGQAFIFQTTVCNHLNDVCCAGDNESVYSTVYCISRLQRICFSGLKPHIEAQETLHKTKLFIGCDNYSH